MAYRISLVEMFVAEEGDETPRPFLEIRSFMFVDRIPEGIRQQSIKNYLRGWIETTKREFLGHIFGSEREDFESKSDTDLTAFREIRKATFQSRIVIEGYEISELDRDELVDHHFKRERWESKFILNSNMPYLYVAFYKKGKSRPDEYDDVDIKKAIGETYRLRMERERLFRKARGLVEEIEQKTVQLGGAITEMEKSLHKFAKKG
jgi:hypothetical protein